MKISKENFKKMYYDEYLKGISVAELSEKYKVTKKYIYRWFNLLNLQRRSNKINSKKFQFNECYFDKIDSPDKAYWLGFIFADGYITSKRPQGSQSLGISLKDSDFLHLQKLNECMNGNLKIHTYTSTSGYGKGNKYSRIVFTSQHLVNSLKNLGVIENKTNILKRPDKDKLDEVFYKDFIRGYFDGDGSVWLQQKNDLGVSFLGTEDLMLFIQETLIKERIIKHFYHLTHKKEEDIVVSFKFGGNIQVMNFLDYIYSNANIFLDRKYDFYQKQKVTLHSNMQKKT